MEKFKISLLPEKQKFVKIGHRKEKTFRLFSKEVFSFRQNREQFSGKLDIRYA